MKNIFVKRSSNQYYTVETRKIFPVIYLKKIHDMPKSIKQQVVNPVG